VGAPARALDADLPAGLASVAHAMDGAELFHGDLVLAPRAAWTREAGRILVASLGEDTIWIDAATGAVWRREEASGEWLPEGTSFDRWLSGWVDAQGALYDRDGEFVDGVIDDDGELTRAAAIERERRILKRDRGAAAPRWRLARELHRAGEIAAARDELERVVADHPGFGWAWYDLARASEASGELAGALDEAIAAAEADAGYEHAGFFLAFAARLARRAGDEAARADLAARALAADADLPRAQRDGARASLEAGELDAARELCEVALALVPRDVSALDLMGQVSAALDRRRR
jgi:tetratricopeptide (TPR) repeat protein